ncbi:hypothetical protein [Paenibacillus chibensis]|nr:hypothetical protein [Paenibacillus chibensis]MEC0368429.1 hypothetical protein [Paenibacillus chibensis]
MNHEVNSRQSVVIRYRYHYTCKPGMFTHGLQAPRNKLSDELDTPHFRDE